MTMPEASLHLSFTGGGARGYAHIGFLKAIEKLALKPGEVSGSSIGSLMAALYASGYSPTEIEDRLLNLKLKEIRRYDYRHISRHRMKALGFWDLSPYQSLIHKWLAGARFKEMPMRLFIQATDLTHFRYVVFSAMTHPEMEVSFAVRASCTYPCMITPVRYKGAVLVDGGVRRGTDVVKALALGATAVGIGRPYVYGAALGGTDGIVHVLRTILAEADLLMAVDGYPILADLGRDAIRRT